MVKRTGRGLSVWLSLSIAAGCVPGVGHDVDPPPPINPGDIPRPPPLGPQPSFGPARNADRPPPPIIGGTLAALKDERTAVAADPDRDRIFVADYRKQIVLAEIPLERGDEPGRVLEDDDGRVHVVLRRGGALVTLTRDPWQIAARRPICTAPRGVAYEKDRRLLHVACAEGQLVSLPPEPEKEIYRRLSLDDDLRDVVVDGNVLMVSRFRSAEVLTLDGNGAVISRQSPVRRASRRPPPVNPTTGEPLPGSGPSMMVPSVAWRLVPLERGQAIMLHQRSLDGEVGVEPGGYSGGGCGNSIVESTASGMGPLAAPVPAPTLGFNFPLALDLAVSPDRRTLAVVSPANYRVPRGTQVMTISTQSTRSEGSDCPGRTGGAGAAGSGGGFGGSGGSGGSGGTGGMGPEVDEVPPPGAMRQPTGEATSIAYTLRGHILVQTREPATIQLLTAERTVLLTYESREDAGHSVFHANSGSALACASCHPEGGDDGRVWKFRNKLGKLEVRRTQNLSGGIGMTAPFHWNGDLKDLGTLMGEVFVGRMNGPTLAPDHVATLGAWMDTIPAPPTVPVRDAAAVERGRALFTATGCAACHNGPMFTNNQSHDVGTGAKLQVPALKGLRWRAPFMHDGCATTLAGRFDARCGGGDNRHGMTSRLTPAQVSDLVTFLETL